MAEEIFNVLAKAARYDCEATSAGFMRGGIGPPKEVIEIVKRLGGDLSGHSVTEVGQALGHGPDLVLTMTRNHLRSVVGVDPHLAERAFTLKEFVRLGEIEGQRLPEESLAAYAGRLAAGRRFSMPPPGNQEDVADPIGKRRSAYEKAGREIEDLVKRVISLISSSSLARRPQG